MVNRKHQNLFYTIVSQIRLVMGPASLADYNINPEYFMENFWAEQHDQFNPCCPNPFSGKTVKNFKDEKIA